MIELGGLLLDPLYMLQKIRDISNNLSLLRMTMYSFWENYSTIIFCVFQKLRKNLVFSSLFNIFGFEFVFETNKFGFTRDGIFGRKK